MWLVGGLILVIVYFCFLVHAARMRILDEILTLDVKLSVGSIHTNAIRESLHRIKTIVH